MARHARPLVVRMNRMTRTRRGNRLVEMRFLLDSECRRLSCRIIRRVVLVQHRGGACFADAVCCMVADGVYCMIADAVSEYLSYLHR